ncbi:MAG: hypothetical protein ACF8XB_13345, partial [Planctomycetota bacterium JB042]
MLRNQSMAYGAPADAIAFQASEARAAFIKKTYAHLLGAIAAFALLCTVMVNSPIATFMINVAQTRFGWLIVLGAFMLVSHVANNWAMNAVDPKKAYLGLGLYVVAQAVIFTPLLLIASIFQQQSGQPILMNAPSVRIAA